MCECALNKISHFSKELKKFREMMMEFPSASSKNNVLINFELVRHQIKLIQSITREEGKFIIAFLLSAFFFRCWKEILEIFRMFSYGF
jgi:hypothetical protein